MNRSSNLALASGISLAALVFVGLFYVERMGLTQEILNVVMLVLGMFGMTAVVAFFRAIDSGQRGTFISIHFNEGINNQALETASKVVEAEVIPANAQELSEENDNFSAASFVGRDNQLALAKLRMDLEKEVQLTAEAKGVLEVGLPLNPSRLFSRLVKENAVDASLEAVWREVFSACSKAIHGGHVDNSTTESIVRVGMKLLAAIRHARLASNKKEAA